MQNENILVWPPSPLGDAVLCTPALRAIRNRFADHNIYFLATGTVKSILEDSNLCDHFIDLKKPCPFAIAKELSKYNFSQAILFKNSFASALSIFLASIGCRIGYARQGRGLFLTEKLHPPKLPNGKFKPVSMLDYYLAIPSWLGCETEDRSMSLAVNPIDLESAKQKVPEFANANGPVVILVPGGAFGPSKCWPTQNFSETADWFKENYNAVVAVSVAPNETEKQIARQICESSKHQIINLADRDITLGRLKALFSMADLVITNDTGPRHIAIALKRKVVTLFGPNDPAWTDSGYENEIKIIGDAPCVPCSQKQCKSPEHLCMESITAEMVCQAGKKLLDNRATVNE